MKIIGYRKQTVRVIVTDDTKTLEMFAEMMERTEYIHDEYEGRCGTCANRDSDACPSDGHPATDREDFGCGAWRGLR